MLHTVYLWYRSYICVIKLIKQSMETMNKTVITVKSVINATAQKAWSQWNDPEHIKQWCNASEDWHAPHAENDLREGGTFTTTMATKDGSFSFDFGGTYTKVEEYRLIEYTMSDGRKVKVEFIDQGNETALVESFDAENTHSEEMQRAGWQAILDNFKKHVESN